MSILTKVFFLLPFSILGFTSISHAAPDAETAYIFNSFSFLSSQVIKENELPGVPKNSVHLDNINISQTAFIVPYEFLLNLSE